MVVLERMELCLESRAGLACGAPVGTNPLCPLCQVVWAALARHSLAAGSGLVVLGCSSGQVTWPRGTGSTWAQSAAVFRCSQLCPWVSAQFLAQCSVQASGSH